MKTTLIPILLNGLALVSVTGHSAEPLSVSGIYPQLTVFNSDPKREKPEPECGLGAVVPWAGKLWCTTYTSHALGRGSDKLFAILPDLSLEIRPESVGGTSACRMIHRESKQLFIASYAIDEAGKVRVIPRDKLPGRLTALARHLTDPANKVLYLTQEGAVYTRSGRASATWATARGCCSCTTASTSCPPAFATVKAVVCATSPPRSSPSPT